MFGAFWIVMRRITLVLVTSPVSTELDFPPAWFNC